MARDDGPGSRFRLGVLGADRSVLAPYLAAIRRSSDFALAGIARGDGRLAAVANSVGDSTMSDEALFDLEPDAIVVTATALGPTTLARLSSASVHLHLAWPVVVGIGDVLEQLGPISSARTIQIGFPYAYHPAVGRASELLSWGALGELYGIACVCRSRRPATRGGAVRFHPGPTAERGGHAADLLHRLVGSHPARVHAELAPLPTSNEPEAAALLGIDLKNGVFATIDAGWTLPASSPGIEELSLSVTGSRGTLALDLRRQIVLVADDRLGRTREIAAGSPLVDHMLADLAGAIRQRRHPRASLDDARLARALVTAAYRSAADGRPTAIDPSP